MSEDGHWQHNENGDKPPTEQQGPARHLCLRCGVRLYSDGIDIHDRAHEELAELVEAVRALTGWPIGPEPPKP